MNKEKILMTVKSGGKNERNSCLNRFDLINQKKK